MTKRSLKSIMPDSLTGMIFAAEGIKKTVVLLNGPMGCKFYHSSTSQYLRVHAPLTLPGEDGVSVPVDYNYLNSWFFRQQRVPCTFLDGYDYVYGTVEKVREGLLFLEKNVDFDLLVIVNSPGASLIGDQIRETAESVLAGRTCVVLESPGYSGDFETGYETAATEIVKKAGLSETIRPGPHALKVTPDDRGSDGPPEDRGSDGPTVNILGLSIWDRYDSGDRGELTRMLALCGIGVNTILCAESTVEEIRNITRADLNLVVNPAAGVRTARLLEEQCGMDAVICPTLPVGFDASEDMMRRVCDYFGADDSAFIRESEKARALAWAKLNDSYRSYGLPGGALFAMEGTVGQVTAYSRFFMDYLGMQPDALLASGTAEYTLREAFDAFSEDEMVRSALIKDLMDTDAELVFGNANTIAALKTTDKVFCGIETAYPGMGYVDIVPKTHLGINGALFLIEQVLNGLMTKI